MLKINKLTLLFSTVAIMVILTGCANINRDGSASNTLGPSSSKNKNMPPESQPYYTNDFNDLLIPGELTWNRDKSMSIKTSSFAGGILQFTGRVEINSLTDFFGSSMTKDGWKMVGTVKQKNNLLIFTKQNKTSMITITDGEFSSRTEVNIYITDDIAAAERNQRGTSVENFN